MKLNDAKRFKIIAPILRTCFGRIWPGFIQIFDDSKWIKILYPNLTWTPCIVYMYVLRWLRCIRKLCPIMTLVTTSTKRGGLSCKSYHHFITCHQLLHFFFDDFTVHAIYFIVWWYYWLSKKSFHQKYLQNAKVTRGMSSTFS